MGSKWAELPEKITNGLGWVGRKVVENNVCPMGMGWAGLKPAQPAHCPTQVPLVPDGTHMNWYNNGKTKGEDAPNLIATHQAICDVIFNYSELETQ